jgi:FkbM family methyltransferase
MSSQSPGRYPEPFNRQKDCRHGRMLYNVHDLYVGRSLELYGEWSEVEIDVFRQILRPGDVVWEIGANIGAHSVPLAKLVGTSGGVFAFEPQRLAFQTLCANVALSSLANVFCQQVAVSDEMGSMRIPMLDPYRDQNFGGFHAMGHSRGEPTPVVALDQLVLPPCRLLKADVEGMELHVLRGARRILQTLQPVLYVENNHNEVVDPLIEFVDSIGYAMFWHEPPMFNPNNYFANSTNIFRDELSHNMLCVPRAMAGNVVGMRPVKGAGTG